MGIPDDVAEYTNRVIDARKLEDYPDDFVQYAKDLKFDQPRGKLPLELRDLLVIFGTHDFGKNASIKREILPFFRRKGKDYVRGWYLHFLLDYLVKLKDWMENTGESIQDCIDKYRKNKAVVIFGTEDELVEAMNFLKKNSQELRKDILGRSGR